MPDDVCCWKDAKLKVACGASIASPVSSGTRTFDCDYDFVSTMILIIMLIKIDIEGKASRATRKLLHLKTVFHVVPHLTYAILMTNSIIKRLL